MTRNEDHGRNATVDWKGHSLDQLLVGHDPIVSSRQYSVDPLQREWMGEGDRFGRFAAETRKLAAFLRRMWSDSASLPGPTRSPPPSALDVDLARHLHRVVVAVFAPAQRTAKRIGVLLRARLAEPAAAAGTGTLSHLLLHRLRQTLRALAQGMIERNAGLPPRRIEFGVARPDFQGAQGSARGCPAPRSPSKPWLTTRPSPRCGGSLRRPRKFRGWKRRPEGTVGRGRQLRVGISHAPVGPFLFLSLFYGNICNPRLRFPGSPACRGPCRHCSRQIWEETA